MIQELWDRLSDQCRDMSFEGQKPYIWERVKVKPIKAQMRGSTYPLPDTGMQAMAVALRFTSALDAWASGSFLSS